MTEPKPTPTKVASAHGAPDALEIGAAGAGPEQLEVVAEIELEDGAPILEALLATAHAALATDRRAPPATVESWWREEGSRPRDTPEAATPPASGPHAPDPEEGPGDERT